MLDESGGPTDLSQLAVPLVGCVVATGDPFHPYRLLDAAGVAIPAAHAYFAELCACGRPATTQRSYGMDLLRWFRFLSAVGVDWEKASRVEARDFCRWLAAAQKPSRPHWRRPDGPAVGVGPSAPNALTGKRPPGPRYAVPTVAHAESVVRAFYDFHLERQQYGGQHRRGGDRERLELPSIPAPGSADHGRNGSHSFGCLDGLTESLLRNLQLTSRGVSARPTPTEGEIRTMHAPLFPALETALITSARSARDLLAWILVTGIVALVSVRVIRRPSADWPHGPWAKAGWALVVLDVALPMGGYPIPLGAVAAIWRTRRTHTLHPAELPDGDGGTWGGQMDPARRPVVVVLGQPDDALLTSLRIVGLAPIADDGEIVIWGPPPPRPPQASTPSTEHPPTQGPPGLPMTIGDAALALGLGRSTVYELIGRGELEVVHVGRSARIPTEALQSLVERLRADQAVRRPVRTVA